MIDDEELRAAALLGRRLLNVTAAWHHAADGETSLLHLWLHLDGLGPVLCHTPGTGVVLKSDQPHGPYSMAEYGTVSVSHDPPEVPLTRFIGRPIRSARDIAYDDGRAAFTAGLTLRFPDGDVRLLGLDDDLVIAHGQHLGPVEAHLHEDVTIARVVQTCGGCPSQWDAWTTAGQYLYLRYRHGTGTVEQHPSDDPDTWDGAESRLLTCWEDGTNNGVIGLGEFLALAGLRLAADADEVAQYGRQALAGGTRGELAQGGEAPAA